MTEPDQLSIGELPPSCGYPPVRPRRPLRIPLWPHSALGWTRATLVTLTCGLLWLGASNFHEEAAFAWDMRRFRQIEPQCSTVHVQYIEDGWIIVACADPPAWPGEPTTELAAVLSRE
jgi:hypothetical protein